MNRLRITARAVLVALALAAPVFADAPIGGREQQYENFIGGDTIITDRFTGLEWDRPVVSELSPYPAAMTFNDAKNACTGGKRLPSLKELLTIVDETPHDEYEQGVLVGRFIDRSAFGRTPPEEFWTSSFIGTRVRTVSFKDGMTYDLDPTSTNKARVRCVRFVAP